MVLPSKEKGDCAVKKRTQQQSMAISSAPTESCLPPPTPRPSASDFSGSKRPAQVAFDVPCHANPPKAPKPGLAHSKTKPSSAKRKDAVAAEEKSEDAKPPSGTASPRDSISDGPRLLDLSLGRLNFLAKLKSTGTTKKWTQWHRLKKKDLAWAGPTASDGHKPKVTFADHGLFMDYYNGEKLADYDLITDLTKAEVEAATQLKLERAEKKALRRFVQESNWDNESGRRVSTVDDPWTPKAIHLLLKARHEDKREEWKYPATGTAAPDDSSVDGDQKKAGYLLKRVFPSVTHEMVHRAAYNRKGGLFNMRAERRNGRHVTDPNAFEKLRGPTEDPDFWLENRFLQYVLDRPHSVCCVGVWHCTTKEDGHHKCRCLSDLKEVVLSSFYPESFPAGRTFGYKGCREPDPITKFKGDLARIPNEFKLLLRPVVQIMVAVTNMNRSTTLNDANVHRMWMQSNLVPHGGSNKGNKLFTVIVPDCLKRSLKRFVGHITFCFGVFREVAGGGTDLLDHRFSRIYRFAFGCDRAVRAWMEQPVCQQGHRNIPSEADKRAKLYTHARYYRKAPMQLIFLAQVALMTDKGQSSPADLSLVEWAEVYTKFLDMFFGYHCTMTENGHRHDMRSPPAASAALSSDSGVPRFPKGTFHNKWLPVRGLFDPHKYLLLADHRLTFGHRRGLVADNAGVIAPWKSDQATVRLQSSTGSTVSTVHECHGLPGEKQVLPSVVRVRHIMFWCKSRSSHLGFDLPSQPGKALGPRHPIDTGVFQCPCSESDLSLAAEQIKQQSYRAGSTGGSGQNAIVGQCNGHRMDLTGNSEVMEEILTAVAILSRQPQHGATGYRILGAECSYRIGLPNSTTMTVDVAHGRAPPGSNTDMTVDVVIPCTDHGCFVRLWPELKAHDKESHTGTVVHVRKGSMLVMPGTMIRGFGISGSTNGNPLLQLSVRVGQAPLLGGRDDGSRTVAGTDLRGVGFLQPQKWWYFLPVGRISEEDGPSGKTFALFPELETDDDNLFWYDNHWFHHFWDTLCS